VGGFPDLNGLASTGVARPGFPAQNFSRQMDADKFVPQQTRKRYRATITFGETDTKKYIFFKIEIGGFVNLPKSGRDTSCSNTS
jgi:hypothetical protein